MAEIVNEVKQIIEDKLGVNAEQITMEAFLDRIRMSLYGKPPARIHVPLTPVRTLLGILEPLLLSVLPLTAGQLASFANDGSCEPHPFTQPRVPGFTTVDSVLRMCAGQ